MADDIMDLKKYKVIIINGLDVEYNLKDGFVNYLGDISEIDHSDVMISYGISVYGDDSIYGIMSEGNYLPIYPAFFLTYYGDNVVFLNTSNIRYGKQGLLYLPDDLSDAQIKSLEFLFTKLVGFEIEVNNDLILEDGLVDSSKVVIRCDGKSKIMKYLKW